MFQKTSMNLFSGFSCLFLDLSRVFVFVDSPRRIAQHPDVQILATVFHNCKKENFVF